MDAVIASVPFGINDVPAMGAFYFIIAPVYRGFVSADRLSRKPGRHPRLTDLFARAANSTQSRERDARRRRTRATGRAHELRRRCRRTHHRGRGRGMSGPRIAVGSHRGDFAGWDTFVWEGQAKAAHLAKSARTARSAARPGRTRASRPGRGCACASAASPPSRAREEPGAIAAYDRGKAPADFGESPVPSFRRPHPAAASPTHPPLSEPLRAEPRRDARRRNRPQLTVRRPAPPAEPEIEAAPPAPSLFDAPLTAPRARPRRPF